jgi:NADH:ubiquinone oxidoreductase subunit
LTTDAELSQVDYKDVELDASQIDPGWHAWMSYLVDKPPVEDKLMTIGLRPWESKEPKINLTMSRAAYRPYSTYGHPKSTGRSSSVELTLD